MTKAPTVVYNDYLKVTADVNIFTRTYCINLPNKRRNPNTNRVEYNSLLRHLVYRMVVEVEQHLGRNYEDLVREMNEACLYTYIIDFITTQMQRTCDAFMDNFDDTPPLDDVVTFLQDLLPAKYKDILGLDKVVCSVVNFDCRNRFLILTYMINANRTVYYIRELMDKYIKEHQIEHQDDDFPFSSVRYLLRNWGMPPEVVRCVQEVPDFVLDDILRG